MTDHPAPLPNDEERQLVEWLADMNEDDALALAKRMLLMDGKPHADKHCDGYAVPLGPQEERYAMDTPRGPRLFLLFAQAK